MEMSHALVEIAGGRHGADLQGGFDKANRTPSSAARGLGLEEGLAILAEVREAHGLPGADRRPRRRAVRAGGGGGGRAADPRLPLPADRPAARRRRDRAPMNVKKGQFLAPWDMKNVAAKIARAGNDSILLTERGASFGYNTLVTDMRALPIMAETGYPVVFDATHSVQQPGGQGTQQRRPARVRAGAGARGRGRRRRRGVHGDAPGPGPRAVGRPEHDPAQGHARPAGAAEGIDALAKAPA